MNAFILEACSQLCSAQLVSIQLLLELCCQQPVLSSSVQHYYVISPHLINCKCLHPSAGPSSQNIAIGGAGDWGDQASGQCYIYYQNWK